MSKETRQLRQARTYARRAAGTSRGESAFFDDTTRYITTKEFMNIGNSVMSVNNALEKSPKDLQRKPIEQEKRQMLEQDLINASDTETAYRAIEYALMQDPLNPTIHFYAGQFFTDSSVRDASEGRNMPAYRNIIALASFATVSRLDMLIKHGKLHKGIRLLGSVKPESAYSWLADVRIAEAFLEAQNQDAAAIAATKAGKMLISLKDYQMAVPLYEFSADVRQDPQSFLMLGEVYATLGLFDEAEKSFMNASGAIPKGRVLWATGKNSEANELFLEATALFQEARAFEQTVRKQRRKK